jgi:hypothetical protein
VHDVAAEDAAGRVLRIDVQWMMVAREIGEGPHFLRRDRSPLRMERLAQSQVVEPVVEDGRLAVLQSGHAANTKVAL